MGFYSRVVFPRLCDFGLDRPFVAKHRQELLKRVEGEVLEIGFGTGLNLPHYPAHVRRLTAIDPNPGMHRKAQQRTQESGIEVDRRIVRSEGLPFADNSFDCVVSTFTLCSIEDVNQAVGEVYRVLKPGGRFLFLEHGLSPEPNIQKWQRRLNWLQRQVADNCHLDRDMRQIVQMQPFRSVEIVEFNLDDTPKTHGHIYQGVAAR